MDNQEPSTSNSVDRKMDMDNVQEETKLKEDLEPENQVEVESESYIDKLPPEMLMEILKYLNIKNIADCRLVNRKWNEIFRDILQSRQDIETVFCCYVNKNEAVTGTRRMSILGTRLKCGLKMFMKYFDHSKESPLYTRFRFDDFELSVFDHADWIHFISDCGPSIKSLRLKINEDLGFGVRDREKYETLKQLVEKLRYLLVNQLPNLQEFGIDFPYWSFPDARDLPMIKLFPTTAPIQLPNFKVIRFENASTEHTGIVTDLLRASVNLQKIEPSRTFGPRFFEDFLFVHQLGKLGCLQIAQIHLNPEFLSKVGEHLAPLECKLKKLTLYTGIVYSEENLWSPASEFIFNLLKSSKNTLAELQIQPVGFLQFNGLQLPKFKKLTKLSILKINDKQVTVLPSGLNLREIFPALQSLS